MIHEDKYMKNIVYSDDVNNCVIQVTFLNVHEKKVYLVMKLINNSDNDVEYYYGGVCSDGYRSKVTGIHQYLITLPYKSIGGYTVPAGYFQEIQVVFDCNTINEEDEFSLKGNFRVKGSFSTSDLGTDRLDYRFKEGKWQVTTTYRQTKNGPTLIDTTVLSFDTSDAQDLSVSALTNPLQRLESLIGLSSVKEEIITLANFVKIQKIRESKGLPSSSISYHCVFTGNPGTGKTTVARIIAAIYKELGILKKGHLVETDRSGLIGAYVGHTALKTNAVIDSALDGVLFIDEAYALSNAECKQDFGQEAIATLLKRMEDNRDRLAVIVAGYSKEMKDFIKSNSGLKSRFLRFIDFPDYSTDELFSIFEHIANSEGYKLTAQAQSDLRTAFEDKVQWGDRDFGNGRYVRNVFQGTIKAQANRLVELSEVTEDDLAMITEQDIHQGVQKAEQVIQ